MLSLLEQASATARDTSTANRMFLFALPAGVRDGRPTVSAVFSPRLADPNGAERWDLCESQRHSLLCEWPHLVPSLRFLVEVEDEATGNTTNIEADVVTREWEKSADLWKALVCGYLVRPFDFERGRKRVRTSRSTKPQVMALAAGPAEEPEDGPRRGGWATRVRQWYVDEITSERSSPEKGLPESFKEVLSINWDRRPQTWSDVLKQYLPDRDRSGAAEQLRRALAFHSRPPLVFPCDRQETDGDGVPVHHVEPEDDCLVLLADPREEPHGVATGGTGFRFMLPKLSDEDVGFQVTLKNISSRGKAYARAFDGVDNLKELVKGDRRSVFVWTGSKWLTELENEIDIHDTLSALSQYPDLAREFGVIVDLHIPEKWWTWLKNRKVRLRVHLTVRRDMETWYVISPWTAADTYESELVGSEWIRVFQARSMAPASAGSGIELEKTYRPVELGLLRPTDAYSVHQFDVDGSAMQIASVVREVQESSYEDDKSRELQNSIPTPRSRPELPALRQGGIAIYDDATEKEIGRAIRRARSFSDVGTTWPNSRTLYLQDLLQGYRVDVQKDGDGTPWRTLCGRRGTYTIDGKTWSPSSHSEGWVGLAADSPAPKDLDLTKTAATLARWDGWALSVPRPGAAIDEEGKAKIGCSKPLPGGPDLTACFEPPPGTLVRLRLGSPHAFRFRAVDLGGNSLSLGEADLVLRLKQYLQIPARIEDAEPFGRVEPVNGPVVIPRHPVFAPGTNDHLVIRSRDEECAKPAEWWVAPPKVAQAFAELHGVFDHLGAKESHALICSLQGDVPRWLDEDGRRGFDKDWLRLHARGGRLRLPYSPDPLSRGAAFIGAPCPDGVITVPFGKDEQLTPPHDHESVEAVRLQLRSGPFESWKRKGRTLVVSLPPGRRRTVDLSSTVLSTDKRYFTLWTWAEKSRRRLGGAVGGREQDLVSGRISRLTPRRPITVVHAVQRPLIPQGEHAITFEALSVHRTLSDTGVYVTGAARLDAPSTGKVDVLARWTEPVDDPGVPDWYESSGQQEAFQFVVPDAQEDSLDPIAFKGQHRFTDTKHRLVEYTARAISRFADYYPDLQATPGDPDRPKRCLTRLSEPKACVVPATAPPREPEVAYIVPTWSTQVDEGRKGRVTHHRKGGGLRIYLKRGWFSSGRDERLAIIVARQGSAWPGPATPLRRAVTEWGVDPVFPGAPLLEWPTAAHFASCCGADNVVKDAKLRVQIGDPLTGQPPTYVMENVDLVTVPVALDKEKGLLYADIDVRTGGAYFPLIRLGLARYQEHAVEGAELSLSVRPAFIQTLPNRAVTLQAVSHRDLRLTVFGHSFSGTDIPGTACPEPGPFIEAVFQASGPGAPGSGFWLDVPGTTTRLALKEQSATGWRWEACVTVPRVRGKLQLLLRESELTKGRVTFLDTFDSDSF